MSYSDHCVFIKRFGENNFIVLLLYVDNMLIVGQISARITSLKNNLAKYFAMKD